MEETITDTAKFAFIGPESSGKTSLTTALAKHYQTYWVPEYARDYLATLGRPYQRKDLLHIAKAQQKLEHLFYKCKPKQLFCDTELLNIQVWSKHKYQQCDQWIRSHVDAQDYTHYFLCKQDFDWAADPLRENPDLGDHFFSVFEQELVKRQWPYTILSGNLATRKKKVINVIDQLV